MHARAFPCVAPLSALVLSCLCGGTQARAADGGLDIPGEAGDVVQAISGDGATLGGFLLDPDFTPRPVLFFGNRRRVLEGTGEIRALSGDGSVAAGFDPVHGRAFRYTATTGIQALPLMKDGDWARADGISANGRFIVGSASDSAHRGRSVAVLWDGFAPPETFRPLDAALWSAARGVDRTGRFVAGTFGTDTEQRGFRYDRKEGTLLTLGSFGGTETTVNALSADGDALVGQSRDADGTAHAFRFRASSGLFESLGTLPGAGAGPSVAHAVNGDGSVVVGTTNDAGAQATGFRFSDSTGLQSVEQWLRDGGATLADGWTASARGVSEDGTTVTGQLRDGRI